LRWAAEQGLAGREWQVEEIWFLASEDFAPAQLVSLPPKRVFLGALKRQRSVVVTQDRRVYSRTGTLLRKTTFYWLPKRPGAR